MVFRKFKQKQNIEIENEIQYDTKLLQNSSLLCISDCYKVLVS